MNHRKGELTDPITMTADIQRAVMPFMSHPISASTVGRELHSTGLHERQLSWTPLQWQWVIFSDESRLCLGGDDQRISVWRHHGQHQGKWFVATRQMSRRSGVTPFWVQLFLFWWVYISQCILLFSNFWLRSAAGVNVISPRTYPTTVFYSTRTALTLV